MRPALLALALVACTASAREKTIATAYATTNSSWAAFSTFDLTYQQGLEQKATDKATLDKQLADYRGKQAKALAAFAVAYRAIAAAETANDQPTLDGVIQAGLILAGVLSDLGVKL